MLVSLLESLDTKVKEHVLLTIGNIAGDGPAMRDEVLVRLSLVGLLFKASTY